MFELSKSKNTESTKPRFPSASFPSPRAIRPTRLHSERGLIRRRTRGFLAAAREHKCGAGEDEAKFLRNVVHGMGEKDEERERVENLLGKGFRRRKALLRFL